MRAAFKATFSDVCIRFLIIVISVLALPVVGVGVWRWVSFDDSYLFPRSSQDWAAWGTWFGGFVAVISIWLAIGQLIHSVKVHKELRKNHDELALEGAKELEWSFHSSKAAVYALHEDLPSQDERLAQEADEQTWWENLSEEESAEEIRKRDEVQPLRGQLELYVRVKNLSADVVFSDLSVQLPVPSERAEVASVVQKPLDEGPEAYRERSDYIEFCEECADCQGKSFSLGALGPKEELVIHLKFDAEQPWLLWAFEDPEYAGPDRGTMHLRYRDSANQYWRRSTVRDEKDVYKQWVGPQPLS